jgi:predicted Fe-Mo cluster-binding NifX family protein
MRILIPILENRGKDSEISLHFGHAPFFAIFDSEKKMLGIFRNDIDHSNPELTPVDQLAKYKIDVVYVKDIGQRAIMLFNQKNIQLKTGNFKTVKEVVNNLDKLEELEGGCSHGE